MPTKINTEFLSHTELTSARSRKVQKLLSCTSRVATAELLRPKGYTFGATVFKFDCNFERAISSANLLEK
jgi:hypothetical protein